MADETTGRYMRMDSMEDRISLLEFKFRVLGYLFAAAGLYCLYLWHREKVGT